MPDNGNPGLVIKRHNIRIWCHDCDMAKLQRVVWEGHGARLLSEVSNQPAVKRFLEAVPYIMNTIREIHSAVAQNDLEGLMKLAGDPVPPQILSSRDAHNMTVMHKAAGLGHGGILGYIADRYPEGINDVDNDGRTPLHYAAAVRDDQHMYNTLVSLGADEGATDNKNKPPGYYINKPQEIDKNLLKTLPDAPRTASNAYPPSWDWKILDTEAIVELNKKSRRKNLKASNENISYKTNSNSVSENKSNRKGGMKGSSTQEFIKDLPDLNEARRKHNGNINNKETEEVEENNDVTEPDDNSQQEDTATQEKEEVPRNIEEDEVAPEIGTHEDSVGENTENKEEAQTEENNDDSDGIENKDNDAPQDPNQDEKIDTHPEQPVAEIKSQNDDNATETNYENEPEEEEDIKTSYDTKSHDNAEHEDEPAVDNNEEDALNDESNGNETGRNTQESLIEGIISGEAEMDSQDASITQRDVKVEGDILVVENEIDPEVAELIYTANMEMLATLVLNGEGSRLVGRISGNSELQAFLDNVPTYMQKINKVHLAAREGNIKDLQAALDRRKFAIARDPISPNGATPLHVATVFGKTNIMKYLGGRFPETLSAVDFEGRTALHYAAVTPDNGHYYNLLQQLGANAKDLDDSGQSAEDYINNPNLLPFNQLLGDFGISEEAAHIMLSDKGTSNAAANGHMDIPTFKTEEGRYLAKSLGDPLIKGLTEVANVKPKDPVAFLASFLHNFPEHEKPQLGMEESNVVVTTEAGEVENEQPPSKPVRSAARTAVRPHRPIDVVTVEPQAPEASPDAPEAAFSSANRDEHGQSMLHFASARQHTNNALFQLLQESDISIGYRDELYRTVRDVSIQANIAENTAEIDRYVLHLAARGNTQKIMELLMEGYDHILDVVDEEGMAITEVIAQRGDTEMGALLASIPSFEESRESLHGAARSGDLAAVRAAVSAEGGRTLARARNTFGRTVLHVAVLAQHEDVVAYLAQTCAELLRVGDNLERTPLHYAMGVEKMESLSRLLIRAGAKRVLKDLKGRQPSYYFMNKSDILRLKEEEEVY